MRFLQLAAVFLIPVAAVVLALTFRSPDPGPPLSVHAQTGSYAATVDAPLSVTAFRISNHQQERSSRSSASAWRMAPPG